MSSWILKKYISWIVFWIGLLFVSSLSSSSFFSIDPISSGLHLFDGVFYTKTGSLSLVGTLDSSIASLEFSGSTFSGSWIYATGTIFPDINAKFPTNTSLTGGTYVLSALNYSGSILGSETIVVDKTAPKAMSITYYDDNRNGKIDRFFIATDEPLIWPVATPYSTGIALNTRNNGLVSTCSYCDLSEFISNANVTASGVELFLSERDNVKPHLTINTNPGSSASDLKFRFYTNANLFDRAGNAFTFTTTVFPNSSTGMIDGTTGIDALDTGLLDGRNFSGSLSVRAIDSRTKTGDLTLSGITLSIAEDSYIGDGNTLWIGTGSKISGNAKLSLGSESRIVSATWAIWFAKSGFSSSFRTLSGSVLSDVSTLTESGIIYQYSGNITGSGLALMVEYVASGSVVSLYSGVLSGTSTLVPLAENLSWGNLRATVYRSFGAAENASFSWVTVVLDILTQSSVSFVASIASTGAISDITKDSARLSGAIFRPNVNGEMCYGTGDLTSTGAIVNGTYVFSGLLPDTLYSYRLGFIPFTGWNRIDSDVYTFRTLPAPKAPPPVRFSFQSTTYLVDQNTDLNEFTCDSTHADCKVNFDLSASFSPDFPASDFFCELDFALDTSNGEEYKCNPNTVTFPRGQDYTLHFRIINSSDTDLASERAFVIHAPLLGSATSSGSTASGSTASWSTSPIEITDSGSTASGATSTGSTDSGSLVATGSLLSSISFAFQQWSYVTDQNPTLNEFSCDTTHDECRINFDLTPSFTGSFHESDYECSSFFGTGVGLAETGKCNPGSVTFPRGQDYPIRFRITNKTNSSDTVERNIVLHVPNFPAPVVVSLGGGGYSPLPAVPSIAPLSIGIPAIVVQSGLDEQNRCKKADCALNVKYDPKQTKESCRWFFPGGSVPVGTENRCNPGYVHYPLGHFTVTLRVYEQGNELNFRESMLSFSNGTESEVLAAQEPSINHSPVAMIKLQGSLGKTKKQSGKSVTCSGVDECSINLSGNESYDLDRDKLSYHFDFGNGVVSDRENPDSVKFRTGTYRVALRVTDSSGASWEDFLTITVTGKDGKDVDPNVSIDPNIISVRISGASPNPLGADGIAEWIELQNTGNANVSLAGCVLDDDLEKGSDPWKIPSDSILAGGAKKRFYKLSTGLNLNNSDDSANLICGGRTISSLVWNYSVPEGFIVASNEWPYSGRVRTTVKRVVDGDTIVVELYGKEEKVRLVGVDTPETVDPRKAVQYFGREASDYTKKMLTGHEIELEFNWDPRDKYDRLLAYVWLDGKNFDAELIRLGYARAYLRFPFKYSVEFAKLQKEAEKNKVGLWADKEVTKALKQQEKEEKAELQKELEEQDKAVMDDLEEVAKDPKIASEKVSDRLFATVLRQMKWQKNLSDPKNTLTAAGADEETESVPVTIVWQGKNSKTRSRQGHTIICQTKKTCSLNFVASIQDKKRYTSEWNLGNGTTFIGANPKAVKYGIGSYNVRLQTVDLVTGKVSNDSLAIRIEPTVKKQKAKKETKAEIVAKSPTWTVREKTPFQPEISKIQILSLTPVQASAAGVVLSCLFFGGGYVLIRKYKFPIG